MPRPTARDDDWWGDPEDPDDAPDDDDEPAIPCPYCRAEILEDAVRCPECGNYISREDAPPRAKPWWVLLGAVACLYAVYRWTVMR